MNTFKCRLKAQGFSAGICAVDVNGKSVLACRATLKTDMARHATLRPLPAVMSCVVQSFTEDVAPGAF
jgi:succinate dehydrogenase/fumarate reductase-like Fe-S protein